MLAFLDSPIFLGIMAVVLIGGLIFIKASIKDKK